MTTRAHLPANLPCRFACALLLATCAQWMAADASSEEVWIVTDSHHPVNSPPGIRIIELDAPTRIHAQLAAQLPSDPKLAAAIVRKRLSDGGKALHQRLAAAYQGVTDAWSLGITKIPAVIADRRYVVYGEPDVNRALSLIENYRRTQP